MSSPVATSRCPIVIVQSTATCRSVGRRAKTVVSVTISERCDKSGRTDTEQRNVVNRSPGQFYYWKIYAQLKFLLGFAHARLLRH
jgi:hypothetical protein